MKRTKIVCTVGPASAKASTLRAMIRAGMNVARLNFSHGTHEAHAQTMALIRAAAKAEGETVTILADLQGPKIRLGTLPEAGLQIASGKTVALSTAITEYRDGGPLPVTFAGLHRDVKVGHRILIDDGLLEVRVTAVRGRVIEAKVINGGKVTSHKGMNFPDTELSISAITEKDKSDAAFAVANGADWVALSFVTKPAQIAMLRRLIRAAAKRGASLPRVIVKIEKHEAIDRFGELLEAVDAVMVARGDLGIEIPAEQVPIWQKKIVEMCRRAGKPVVVATQMLDSMIRNPRPTRAEVSDVANAVFDHADAVMLSGETASGSYPVEAVRMMARIVEEAEASPFDDVAMPSREESMAEDSAALALKALTVSGHADAALASLVRAPWAPRATSLRPEIPFYLAVADEASGRQENLRWGIRPFLLSGKHGDGFRAAAIAALKRAGKIGKGDRLAILDGDARGVGVELVDI